MHFLSGDAHSMVFYPQNRLYLPVFCVQHDPDPHAWKLLPVFKAAEREDASFPRCCSRSLFPVLSCNIRISGKESILRTMAGMAGKLGALIRTEPEYFFLPFFPK